ncbi:MAG: peptidoglycan bridge formation glycyltransferase FemA/FemB family protein [Candidatus Woesebacteria bacterium]
MIVRSIEPEDKALFDSTVSHPLQSFAWGEFRKKTGTVVERIGVFDEGKLTSGFQVSFHPLPFGPYTAGYFPKGLLPDERMFAILKDLGKRHNALFIKLEPNVSAPIDNTTGHGEVATFLLEHGCVVGKPLFTPYTFVLSLLPTEEELLAKMHQKTRYNINLASKKGVQVVEDTSEQGLKEYMTLLFETTKRQGFYAHDENYYQKMYETLQPTGMLHIFKATFEGKTLSVWIVFVFNNVLYYPYGASSRENREVMANNLLAWEVIKFGKSQGCTRFDMWGSLGPDANPKDPWYGFHTFKAGYGGVLTKFVGTYDLVLDPKLYPIVQTLDKWRWVFLRMKKKFGM